MGPTCSGLLESVNSGGPHKNLIVALGVLDPFWAIVEYDGVNCVIMNESLLRMSVVLLIRWSQDLEF